MPPFDPTVLAEPIALFLQPPVWAAHPFVSLIAWELPTPRIVAAGHTLNPEIQPARETFR